MAITAPSNLSASAVSASKINLSWSRPDTYDDIYVQRSPTGAGSWVQIAVLIGTATNYSDTSCVDGTKYYYRLYCTREDPPQGAYSNTANATTTLPAPSGLTGSSNGAGTQVDLEWVDNSTSETAFKVYQDGVLIATLGANVTTHTATGLTAGRTYVFKVRASNTAATSAYSNEFSILTADPPAKPSGLTATTKSTTEIDLAWVDNADNETKYKVERSTDGINFAQIALLNANVTVYADSGLTSNTPYWYQVRAYNSSGNSAYSNVATTTTWADIAAPSNLVAVMISDTTIDIYFDDNSNLEDFHCLERKKNGGAYSEIVQLEPNRTAYRDTGLIGTDANVYYRVRAKQGAATYSDYSNEALVAMMLPTADTPSDLACTEYQDTWARLTWAVGVNFQIGGVLIERSATDAWAGEEVTVASIPASIFEFKITGLTASTLYYFRVTEYNAKGYGTPSASVAVTTRSSYSPSKFERLIKQSSPNLNYLVEMNPATVLQGWALSSGKSYTYEIALDAGEMVVDAMEENGVALIAYISVSFVEASPGGFWHDTLNGKLYVHPTGDDDPNNYVYTGSFWQRFTMQTQEDSAGRRVTPTVFNGNLYLPLVEAIPDISQEISPYYEGNFVINSGSISMLNAQVAGANWWDKRWNKYIMLARPVRILAGGDGFAYTDYVTVSTGIIDSVECTDRRATFTLRDKRDGINRTLPVAKFTDCPRISDNAADTPRPFGYGTIAGVVPVCIDTTNRVFEVHNGRIKSIDAVTQNGVTLTGGTDYFIDYQRGRVTLARGLTYSDDDIILISFKGAVTTADEVIETGADIFRDILINQLGLTDDDLDQDSIWATHLVKTTALSLYVWKETDSQELIRRIERSIEAYSFQTGDGLLGIKPALTTAPSDITYIPDAHVLDFGMTKEKSQLYSTVNVWYGEDQAADKYSLLQCANPHITYKYRITQALEVYTALSSAADAATLGSDIVELLDKTRVRILVPRTLFQHLPGDLVYLTRTRYYDTTGTANNKLLRILAISKSFSAGRTEITAEEA